MTLYDEGGGGDEKLDQKRPRTLYLRERIIISALYQDIPPCSKTMEMRAMHVAHPAWSLMLELDEHGLRNDIKESADKFTLGQTTRCWSSDELLRGLNYSIPILLECRSYRPRQRTLSGIFSLFSKLRSVWYTIRAHFSFRISKKKLDEVKRSRLLLGRIRRRTCANFYTTKIYIFCARGFRRRRMFSRINIGRGERAEAWYTGHIIED